MVSDKLFRLEGRDSVSRCTLPCFAMTSGSSGTVETGSARLTSAFSAAISLFLHGLDLNRDGSAKPI